MNYEKLSFVDDLGRLVERDVLIIKCEECDEKVACTGFTNSCFCGADYDSNGDKLADRSQWGYETGENWRDII
ncbi:hypothetical protein [Lacicoccus qingdaonensis]|uniref:Uncharacterized protein n=1 Tax=Lacicoccus qingdaonensis TaxID=576118 RepID=A0A1G9EZ85_9BACL|nr:hypothetical protein [Salinicoccus qingdaonensis]SDK81371.1 hypothetical protein SAMN05216216_11057 [Salinicoccus qingdaonensis]